MTALGLLAGLVALLVAGDALGAILRKEPVTIPVRLAEAFLFGAGALTLALLVLLRLGAPLGWSVVLLALSSLTVWIAVPARPALRARIPHGTLPRVLAGLLVFELAQAATAALVSPLTAWDSWVSWWSKAQGIVLDGALTSNLLGNPDRLPTNASYPLLVPLAESWLLTFAPAAGERAAGVVSLSFFAALLALAHALLRKFLPSAPALGLTWLLAATPRVFRFAPIGMADLPLAAFVLLAFSLLPAPPATAASPRGRAVAAFALACAFLPWTKDEGWIWLALATLALALLHGLRPLAIHLPVGLGLAALWPIARSAWPSFPYVFGPAPHLDRAPAIALGLARCLVSPAWSFLWPIALLASVAAWKRLAAGERILLAAPALFLAISSGAYLFSRFDPWTGHLKNSVDRLALQAFPLAVAGLGACAARAGWLPRIPEEAP